MSFAPVSAFSAAMSSSFSSVVRGSPPRGKRPKRVPPVPSAHDGAATENRWTSPITASTSTPALGEPRAECVEVALVAGEPMPRARGSGRA